MYKVKNPYKECHIMDLNMMGVAEYKKTSVSKAEVLLTVVPVLACVGVLFATMIPDMQFFAECQNIRGGDICSLSFK